MHTVRQLLQSKGSDIWSIAPRETAYKALQIMADKEIGVLLVIDGEKLVGIFSERDYARKVILKGKSSKAFKAKDWDSYRNTYVNFGGIFYFPCRDSNSYRCECFWSHILFCTVLFTKI